jgi:Zn-dependent protease
MFTRGSLTLFRVRSIPVRAHWTLLLIIPYLALVFALQFGQVVAWSGIPADSVVLPAWAWGILLAIGLFASVAIHELAHAFVAVRSGGRVRDITLMLLGGVSQIEQMPKRPPLEALMAFAGPLTSFVLGAVLLAFERLPLAPDVHFGLYYLGRLNIVLALFNLLPAFPLDGGRILRALLATRMGMLRATRVAAITGKIIAIVLGLVGALGGNFLLLLIALFVYGGANFEARAVARRELLARTRIRDIMASPLPIVRTGEDLAEALATMQRSVRSDLVVVDANDNIAGILRAEDIARVPEDHRGDTRVAELYGFYRREIVIADGNESAADALARAAGANAEYVVVAEPWGENITLRGLVGPAEVANAFALHTLRPARGRPELRPRSF